MALRQHSYDATIMLTSQTEYIMTALESHGEFADEEAMRKMSWRWAGSPDTLTKSIVIKPFRTILGRAIYHQLAWCFSKYSGVRSSPRRTGRTHEGPFLDLTRACPLTLQSVHEESSTGGKFPADHRHDFRTKVRKRYTPGSLKAEINCAARTAVKRRDENDPWTPRNDRNKLTFERRNVVARGTIVKNAMGDNGNVPASFNFKLSGSAFNFQCGNGEPDLSRKTHDISAPLSTQLSPALPPRVRTNALRF
ncbi:hypothetical protein EDB83DRAFT_2311588 [Lactarius deliciosus]|nr:hypothetical protein EDB83DRAFT_2311588 [Lactarius deliciosus]